MKWQDLKPGDLYGCTSYSGVPTCFVLSRPIRTLERALELKWLILVDNKILNAYANFGEIPKDICVFPYNS